MHALHNAISLWVVRGSYDVSDAIRSKELLECFSRELGSIVRHKRGRKPVPAEDLGQLFYHHLRGSFPSG